jgi:RNA polymerase sigma-70 factor (ECF subfamily)
MDSSTQPPAVGQFDARYLAYLETVAGLRPSLHRYCARMTGSALDGEDVVQEALFQAYRKLDSWNEALPLAPWLFRIAHNRCIDFLRRRAVRAGAEAAVAAESADSVEPFEPAGPELGRAVEHLVIALPPKERACVLLKDVFDYTLEEIAELVDSTVGGVKAALNRGRSKLAALQADAATAVTSGPTAARSADPEMSRLLRLYVERFNRGDWDGLRELISADARLLVADRFSGRLADSPYFGQYQRSPGTWRVALGEVDGEPVVVTLRRDPSSPEARTAAWLPHAAVRFALGETGVVGVTDYAHCPWVLRGAAALLVSGVTDRLELQ